VVGGARWIDLFKHENWFFSRHYAKILRGGKYIPFTQHIEIDSEHLLVIIITGNYDAKRSQMPNVMPYDPSRYMHRHRGKGKK